MAQVRTRKRGKTYSYIFEAGKVDGRRKVVEKGGYPTKAAAYKAGVEAYNDWLHGNIGITSESVTLADFMANWLNNVVALNVKATSMQMYQSLARNQILPLLGSVKVQDLTPAMVDNWLRTLQKEGLSNNTIRHARTLICQVLNYAVYPAQLISSNPAAAVKTPKKTPRNIVKRTIITPDAFRALTSKYPPGTDYYIPLLLLYYTGMRCGELIGLTWDAIDFEKKLITIDKQIVYLHKRGYFFSTLKTPSSNRTIAVDDFLIGELRRLKEQQQQNEAAMGDKYVCIYCNRNTQEMFQQSKAVGTVEHADKRHLVCTHQNGRAVLPYSIGLLLKKEGLNTHSFRHSHTTILIENGATPKAVSARLGHSDVYITQNLYTHITDKMNENTADIFTKIMQTNP